MYISMYKYKCWWKMICCFAFAGQIFRITRLSILWSFHTMIFSCFCGMNWWRTVWTDVLKRWNGGLYILYSCLYPFFSFKSCCLMDGWPGRLGSDLSTWISFISYIHTNKYISISRVWVQSTTNCKVCLYKLHTLTTLQQEQSYI